MQACDILQTTYESMAKVKTKNLQMLRRDFETICMKVSHNIDVGFTQVIGPVTQIRSYGETLEDRRIFEKSLRSFPSIFDCIVATIKETKDIS